MFLFLKCMHAVRIASFIILNGTHQLKSLKGYWHYIWANYFYLENYTYSSGVILSYRAWCFSLPLAYICWARTGNICITFLFIWWASESKLGLLNCCWTLGNHMWHCVVWMAFKTRGFVWAWNMHHCSTYACVQEGWERERRATVFPKYKRTGKRLSRWNIQEKNLQSWSPITYLGLIVLEATGHLQPIAGSGTGPPASSSLWFKKVQWEKLSLRQVTHSPQMG